MKKQYWILIILMGLAKFGLACPVCERQQPKVTMGLTHGAGPGSNWDWIIIGFMSIITLLTLFYSVKYLIKLGEKREDHIKQSILREEEYEN